MAQSWAAPEAKPDKPKQFIYVLRLVPRLYSDANWTAEDNAALGRHFNRFKDAIKSGQLILAGRTSEPGDKTFGIAIFEAPDEAAARKFMEQDPAVTDGLMTAELHPFAIALQRNGASDAANADNSAPRIVDDLRRADYAGDQAGMKRCYNELAPFLENKELASRIRYWRGFAMWRRAINGFNDSVDPKELEEDLNQALDEFKEALALDPGFVDAKIATVSCYGFLAFMKPDDQTRVRELIGKCAPLIKEAKAAAPDNPRLLWVLGPVLWNTPPERGGGQDKAIENYGKGLDVIRKTKLAGENSLEPSWGEPELLMSLAWSHLNKKTPDVEQAERCARSALAIGPDWHYVRDILLPQILEAKGKAKLADATVTK
jgi:uncharacterized protein YciI